MGFNKVYKCLLEIFPEVDSRLLRAVAIEHPKNADSAAEVVLTEIIPYVTAIALESTQSRIPEVTPSLPGSSAEGNTVMQAPSSSSGSSILEGAGAVGTTCTEDVFPQTTTSQDVEPHGQFYDAESDHDNFFRDENGGVHQLCGDSSTGKLMSFKNYDATTLAFCANVSSPVPSSGLLHGDGANADCVVYGGCKSKDAITCDSYQENGIEVVSSLEENSAVDQIINNSLHVEPINGENYEETNCPGGEAVRVVNSLDRAPLSGFGTSQLNSYQCDSDSIDVPDILNSESVKESNDAETDASKIESRNEFFDVIDESAFTKGATPSIEVCSFDLVEDIIADARNNKRTLFSAMESVISLMKEVELQEKAAERAKEEAAEECSEIFKHVDEIKQIIQQAKEANEMHAGEVSGEKAILGTEVRELQSRLFSLSDERDKSLAILDEMHQSLEVRLATAEKETEAAKREKLEKEENGKKLLADQEKIMEKVVEESNILRKQAEENAKLHEFLMDRGHVVDILQGEISVICKDVRLLKEKFDERLPLCRSLNSSQTSCILASSSSSLKSMVPEHVDPVNDASGVMESVEKTDRSSIALESFGVETEKGGHKVSIDEGWELCDNRGSYL